MVNAFGEQALISPFQYEGTMDSELFEYWFTNHLMSELPENSFIVMDNARFHCKSQLKEILSGTGHQLLFLPPYSPDLNLIEKCENITLYHHF